MDGVYGYGCVGLVDLGRCEVAGRAVGVALDTFIVVEVVACYAIFAYILGCAVCASETA